MNKKLKLLISFISVFLVLSVVACSVFVIVDLKKNSDGSSSAVPETGENESSYSESIEENSEISDESSEEISSEESSSSPPPHTHQYSVEKTVKPDCKNKGYTIYKCSCGESYKTNEIAALGHSFSDWKTTKEPTVEAEGVKERTCSRCGEKETKSIEKLPKPEPPVNPDNSYEYIMGTSVYSADHLASFAVSQLGGDTSKVSLYCSLYEIAKFYISEGAAEGVRGDIAFCQALIETGVFRYGNDVKWDQNNFCGLGATGGGNPGNSFPTVQTGVRAHIQHLVSYATDKAKTELANDCVDLRFAHGYRGKAPKWEDLAGKWADDSQYGVKIIAKFKEMASTPINDQYLAVSKIKVEK